MSPFHFCLSAAKNLSSFHLLPVSLITDLFQLFLGLPLFLFPWELQSRGAFGISSSSFLNVWPIHLKFLFLISKFISSCHVTFHRSLLEIIFGHHIFNIYIRHLFTKVCILRWIFKIFRVLSQVAIYVVQEEVTSEIWTSSPNTTHPMPPPSFTQLCSWKSCKW